MGPMNYFLDRKANHQGKAASADRTLVPKANSFQLNLVSLEQQAFINVPDRRFRVR